MSAFEIVKGQNWYLVYRNGKLVQWFDTKQEAEDYVKEAEA